MIAPTDIAELSESAHARIKPHIEHTPLVRDASLSYKCENLQKTGSFKSRGATAKLTSLSAEERSRGVVAASTGNHGAGVAYAAGRLGIRAIVYVPDMASPLKVQAIRDLGAEVRIHGSDGVDSEIEARRVAGESGAVYVSPYNDPDVIAGQGTLGIELLEDVPDIDTVVVAVGGGGLISGVASVLKEHRPEVRVVGCSPSNSAAMAASLEAGEIIEAAHSETISDGTHGGVEPESITFGLCQQLIDDFVLVPESEIRHAMKTFMDEHQMKIEGSAGVALAAANGAQAANTVVILCGGNVSDERLGSLWATS